MLDLETVKKDIEHWIANFVEVPHPSLGGWPPCPYAKKARLERDFDVKLGTVPIADLQLLATNGLTKSVIIYVYDPAQFPHSQFSQDLEFANATFLLHKDIIVLEDHPDDVEIVNGVCMNQGQYALAMCQSVGDLDVKAQHMASKGFYNNWPDEYLNVLFKFRKDPRQI